MKKEFDKINEHVLIPLLFVLGSMAVRAIMYFVNELFKPEARLQEFYLLDSDEILRYKKQSIYLIFGLCVSLVGPILGLKFKNRLLSAFLILANIVLLVLCIKLA